MVAGDRFVVVDQLEVIRHLEICYKLFVQYRFHHLHEGFGSHCGKRSVMVTWVITTLLDVNCLIKDVHERLEKVLLWHH